MSYRHWLLLLSSAVFLTPGYGQLPTGYIDPAPVLRAVNEAMGVDKLNCVTFSGVGYTGRVGQNVLQSTDWPLGEPLAP